MSVTIDDDAFLVMNQERVEMENELALLREQRNRLLEACRPLAKLADRVPDDPKVGVKIETQDGLAYWASGRDLHAAKDAVDFAENKNQ